MTMPAPLNVAKPPTKQAYNPHNAMQFSTTAEKMHADAIDYNERLEALREESIQEQETDEQWLNRWTREEN